MKNSGVKVQRLISWDVSTQYRGTTWHNVAWLIASLACKFSNSKRFLGFLSVHSMPMMDLLVQIATAHKLTASSYTLQAIGERGIVLPHQPNTPIGALDALQVLQLHMLGNYSLFNESRYLIAINTYARGCT